MLKVWIGIPEEDSFKGQKVNDPDLFFKRRVKDLSFMDSDFSHRVVKELSRVSEVLSCVTLRTKHNSLISPMQLSSGAKNVLIMKYFDCACNMTWCGENCEKFVEEIADEKDLIVFSTRYYIPYLETKDWKPFEILNLRRVYETPRDCLMDEDVQSLIRRKIYGR